MIVGGSMSYRDSISGIGFISKSKERLPLGNGSRGRFVPPSGKRAGILVPSFGALEKEEIDYIVEAEQEKEDTRVRHSEQKEKLERASRIAMNAKKGKRIEVLKELGGI